MIKYMYASKNKLSGNFNTPMLHDFPKEAASEAFAISAKEAPKESRCNELEIYYLGTYDTKTGEIKCEKEFLIDLGTLDGEQEASK